MGWEWELKVKGMGISRDGNRKGWEWESKGRGRGIAKDLNGNERDGNENSKGW
jgi:hypothetical protein